MKHITKHTNKQSGILSSENVRVDKLETLTEQRRRSQQALSAICLGVSVANVPVFLVLALLTGINLFWMALGLGLIAGLGYAVSYWLGKHGYLTPAIYLIIILSFGSITAGLLLLDLNQISFFYLVSSIIALTLVGSVAGGFFTLLAVFISGLISLWRGGLLFGSVIRPATDSSVIWLNTAVTSIVMLALFAVMIFLYESIQRASRQARVKSEQLEKALAGLERRLQEAEISQKVLSAASELNATAAQLTSGATQQVQAIMEVSQSLEELNSTTGQIALAAGEVDKRAGQVLLGASQVRETATKAADTGVEGQRSVNTTVKSVAQVGELYGELTDKLLSVSTSANSIRQLVNTMKAFADETHLLALNASIEAAGAGEFGSRFGVVAHEVKGLANRSLKAAKEAGQLIADLEASLEDSLIVVGKGQDCISEATDMAHESGAVIDNLAQVTGRAAQETNAIVGLIKEVKLMAEEIGLITRQQQAASSQILDVLGDVTVAARQTSASSTQLLSSSRQLEDLSTNLRNTLAHSA